MVDDCWVMRCNLLVRECIQELTIHSALRQKPDRGAYTNKNTLTKKSQNAFRPILQYLQWSFQVWFKIQNIFCWIVLQLQFNLWCTIPGRIYDMSVLICLYTYIVYYIYISFLNPSHANWQKPYYWDGFLAAAYTTLLFAVFVFWMCAKRTVHWGSSIQAALPKPDQQC